LTVKAPEGGENVRYHEASGHYEGGWRVEWGGEERRSEARGGRRGGMSRSTERRAREKRIGD